jgi:fumarate hydratase class II
MTYRIESDSLGEVRLPQGALYGAQTQRALDNFPISGVRFPRVFIQALGLIKGAAAKVNQELGLLPSDKGQAIQQAADEVAEGRWDDQFPLDIFQTGSGTSTNMNANEVIANRASQLLGGAAGDRVVHPNDHVNLCQSSNDVIPSAIHVSAAIQVDRLLLPGLRHLRDILEQRASALDHLVKTGRTHLMDALPIRMGQEIDGWASQIDRDIGRIEGNLPLIHELALGGTAVGTGLNAHSAFARRATQELSGRTGIPFAETPHHFAAQAALDGITELSGSLKTTASGLFKIANDLRWMNSGPIAGLGEIRLPELQPGSSIMPGKINPVICEAVMMVCVQVIGNDVSVTMGNSQGNFQLNIMLPLIAHNILQSLTILGKATRLLADKTIAGMQVNEDHITGLVGRNPILVTALNTRIGYDRAAQIARRAYQEGRPIAEVAAAETDLSLEELRELLDPARMT